MLPRFPGQPPSVCLPKTSTLVEDPDEEIFLLYVRKQTAPASAAGPGASAPPAGLGFLSSKQDILPIELRITPQPVNSSATAADSGSKKRGKGKGKGKDQEEEVVVCVEVQQSLEALRNRKGDTGSVLWRTSVHLAQHLLTAHHFPSPSRPALLPALATARVLELGSGTGFLGLALRQIAGHWTFSDQLASLALVAKNLDRNAVEIGDLHELDWMVEGAPGRARDRSETGPEGRPPDVIVAADCIYNPSLAGPLARTIDRVAGEGTVALVACELRDAEPLEEFLREWVEGCGWTVARIGGPDEADGASSGPADEIFGREFVVWVGWRGAGKGEEGAA